MCIIIDNHKGKKLPEFIVSNSLEYNKHGFAYYDIRKNILTKTMKADEMEELLRQETPFLAHCRFATVGGICESNIHFFESGPWIIAMNGTIAGLADKTENDTKQMIKMLQHVKPKEIAKFLSYYEARFLLYNRRTKQKVTTGQWFIEDGVLYSKDNVLNEKAYTLREESKNRKHSAIVPYNYGARSYDPFYNDSDAYYKNRPTNKVITNSSAQSYVQHVNGQWVPHQSKIIVPKSTNLDKVYLAVYDSMKKGKPNHHILKAATFCFNGHTNAKYDYIKEGNESYVLSDMNVKGIKVPVEVYTMSAKDYDELKKVILPALTQQEQYIVSIDNNYKNGRLCKMFFYPTDKAELTFDSLTYIEAF